MHRATKTQLQYNTFGVRPQHLSVKLTSACSRMEAMLGQANPQWDLYLPGDLYLVSTRRNFTSAEASGWSLEATPFQD